MRVRLRYGLLWSSWTSFRECSSIMRISCWLCGSNFLSTIFLVSVPSSVFCVLSYFNTFSGFSEGPGINVSALTDLWTSFVSMTPSLTRSSGGDCYAPLQLSPSEVVCAGCVQDATPMFLPWSHRYLRSGRFQLDPLATTCPGLIEFDLDWNLDIRGSSLIRDCRFCSLLILTLIVFRKTHLI